MNRDGVFRDALSLFPALYNNTITMGFVLCLFFVPARKHLEVAFDPCCFG
jgi:hypothetical protein